MDLHISKPWYGNFLLLLLQALTSKNTAGSGPPPSKRNKRVTFPDQLTPGQNISATTAAQVQVPLEQVRNLTPIIGFYKGKALNPKGKGKALNPKARCC